MKSLSPMFAGSFGLAVRRNGSRLAVLLAAFFVIFAAQALAQEATILGTVTDPTGATVPNAAIVITNTETGVARNSATNSDGQYVAPDLKIGTYTIRVTASGFKATEQKNVVLAVGDRTRLDFKLQVGSTQEQVTVEANAVAVQTDSGEVSTVINGQQVTNLGINGRSLYSLFALAPGASSIQTDRVGFTPVSGDSNVSINGQRAGHNLQLLDGGENLDRGGSSGSVMPSIDSIAEFRNMTSNYSAEYGLSSAATITTVIKSGHQAVPRVRLGVLPQRRSQRAQLLQPGTAESCRVALQHLRLQRRRSGSAVEGASDFLLLQPGVAPRG